jgi:hypothetical protein
MAPKQLTQLRNQSLDGVAHASHSQPISICDINDSTMVKKVAQRVYRSTSCFGSSVCEHDDIMPSYTSVVIPMIEVCSRLQHYIRKIGVEVWLRGDGIHHSCGTIEIDRVNRNSDFEGEISYDVEVSRSTMFVE